MALRLLGILSNIASLFDNCIDAMLEQRHFERVSLYRGIVLIGYVLFTSTALQRYVNFYFSSPKAFILIFRTFPEL